MKNLIFIFAAVIALSGCTKDPVGPEIRGKLVYRSCATIAVQVLDSSHYYLGDPVWQAPDASKTPYQHVFAVANNCSFPGGMPIGQEFTFKVLRSDPANRNCYVCMLWDNPPQKKHLIKVVLTRP